MKILIPYAMSFVGQPYIWGGDVPMSGWDCSGLVQELMMSVDVDIPGDQTADAYYRHFKVKGDVITPQSGALLFFGSEAHVSHVAFSLDAGRMIEAGGGDRTCTSVRAAVEKKAFVRIRPISRRRDLVAACMPIYPDYVRF